MVETKVAEEKNKPKFFLSKILNEGNDLYKKQFIRCIFLYDFLTKQNMIKPTTPTVNKLMYILLGDGHSRLGYYESPGDFPHLLPHVHPHHGSILDVRVGTQQGLQLSWRHLPREGNNCVIFRFKIGY